MLRSSHPHLWRRAAAGSLGALVLVVPGAAFGQEYPPSAGILAVSNTSPAPGEAVTVAAGGYAAGAGITITFESDPVVIGNVQADSSGSFTTQVRIPADASPGNHTIRATGRGADGATRVASAAIVVRGGSAASGGGGSAIASPGASGGGGSSSAGPATATRSGRLAFTGLGSLLLVAVGLGLVASGLGLATMARRRRATGPPAA